MSYTAWVDGSVRRNGCGGVGVVLDDGKGHRSTMKFHQCETTSQRMELYAVIVALASTPLGSTILVKSDCKVVTEGFNGNWNVKANLDLWRKLRGFAKRRKTSIIWIPRMSEGPHQLADELAKAASGGLDAHPDM